MNGRSVFGLVVYRCSGNVLAEETAAVGMSETEIGRAGAGSDGARLRSNNSANKISSVKCWFFKMLAAVLPSIFSIVMSAPASIRRLT